MRLAPAPLLAAMLLLTACGQDGNAPRPPDPSATSSSSPSPKPSAPSSSTTAAGASPTATPDPPPLPPAAANPDAVGAAAFVRYWFDLANYAYVTGDTVPLAAASEAECGSCESIVSRIADQYSSGGSIEGGVVTVEGAEAAAPENGVAMVTTVFVQAEVEYADSTGRVTETVPASERTTAGTVVFFSAGAWKLTGFGTI